METTMNSNDQQQILDMSILIATKQWEWSPQVQELNDGARVARERLEALFYYQEQMFRHLNPFPWIIATMKASNVRR